MPKIIYKLLSSTKSSYILLSILAIGASIGTFIENDFGNIRARELIYNAFWYNLTLLLTSLNILFVAYDKKMYLFKIKTMFHLSFVLIFVGAGITYYFGIEGMMNIRENNQSNIIISGEQEIELPFFIKLKDFTLIRYPGSRSPSEFSSDVVLIDEKNNIKFDTKIYMNNTLTYNGYKFFQTSYDMDELGTKLTVNYDPGLEITYIAYFFLFLGLILNLFDKNSRFQKLISKIKKMPIASIIFTFLLIFPQTNLIANDKNNEYITKYLIDYRENSKKIANKFGELIVQDSMGRMKPLDTQNKEVLNKLTGKDIWNGLNANQVMLSILSRPSLWKKVNLIKIGRDDIKFLLGMKNSQNLARFDDFFDINGNYRLSDEVHKANIKDIGLRNNFEREIIKIDERLNIFFMSYKGKLLTIFPLKNNKRKKWADLKTMFLEIKESPLKRATANFLDGIYNRNYKNSFKHINIIKDYQYKVGGDIIPDINRLKAEIYFNEISIFVKLSIIYLAMGLVLLIYAVISIFYNKLINKNIYKISFFIMSGLFIIHTVSILLRWYIGGYAPISNTYETMVYISYIAIISGLFLSKKSLISLSGSLLIAGIFMFLAYLQDVNPQITNLVPVLKSYWLSIHVSVITASYGFFAFGATLGFITLVLIIINNSNNKIKNQIKTITYINEVSLILGLTLLVIGNFLGSIWANESWGRYWGWDPKETWAYISIIVYVMVIHIRFFKKLYNPFIFSSLSLVSFLSILMTYFGVNFYLAGMHSYAKGDPIPIPLSVYIFLSVIILTISMAYIKQSKEKNEKI